MNQGAIEQPEQALPRRLAMLAAVLLLAFVAGYRAWLDIATIAWQDPEQSQVLLTLPAFAMLLVLRRGAIEKAHAQPSLIGLAVAAAGFALSALGYMHAIQSAWHMGAVVMLVGAAWSVLGNKVMLAALPAIITLAALVPVPNMVRQDIALPLQRMTAQGAEFVLIALNLDVKRIGLTLLYQNKPVTIEEACNGMRMVFALALVSYAFVMSLRLTPFARLMLLAVSPLLAVLCNIIRVVPTVIIYGEFGDGPGDVFHDLSGWAMIILAALMLMGMVRVLAWAEVPIYAETVVPKRQLPPREQNPRIPHALGPVGVALLMISAGIYSFSLPGAADAQPYHRAVAQVADATPTAVPGLTSNPIEMPEGSLKLLRPNTARAVHYTDDNSGAEGQFLLIQSKDARDLSGHYPPRCYPNVYGYVEVDRRPKQWEIQGQSIDGMQYTFAESNEPEATRWVVMHIFALPGGGTTGQLTQMRAAAADYLRRHRGAAQVQLLFSDSQTTPQQRDQMFVQVMSAHAGLMNAILDGPKP